MVKAACKFTPDWLIIVQLLTAVTLTLLAFDADIVTCESIIPHEFSGVDKHHPNHNSESQVSVLVAATQRDETGDNLSSSPHTLHAESGSSFVSQNQQLLPNVGWVTAASRQKNVPTEEYSDFRTSRPYFFHMKAKISHTVTHELKKSTTSEQKSIKEDIPLAETTFLAERIRDSSERHSKFESGSQKLSEKALTLPPVDRELIEVNSSFQNEKRPFDDSVNNSFSNKSIANAQEVYDSRYTSELYEENFNAIHETLLSSDKLIRNFTCNMSSFVEDSSHDIEVNKSGKTTSDLRDLLKPSQNEPIKVINITPNTYNRWSSQEEHSSDLNVSSEMNNESITTANTNGVDINVPIQGSVRSLALSHTEADRKLFRVSDLINSNVREGEISNSLLEIENLLHLDRNSNGSSTREIFSAAQTTALTKLSRAALSSEPQKAESRTHKVEATEDRLDSANGIEESLNYEVIVSEVNGSWVDTGGGNISEKTRRDCFKVEGETDFVSNTDTVTSVSSTSSEHDSRQSEIWTLGSSGNVRVNSNGAATVNDGYDAPTGQDIGGSDMLVQKQNGDMSSEIRLSKDNLRSHKTRHISLLKLFKIIANESVLRSGQNNSIFVKHKLKDLNTKPINVPYEIYFTNDSTKDAENLSFDSNVLQAQIVKPVVYFGNVLHRPGNNKTSYVQSDVSEDANEANITHSEDTKLHQNASFELTEDIIREMPTLTSEQLQNDGNSTDYSNIKYLNNPSEDVTFNANLLMNFIASTNNGLSYTGNYDKNYNTSTSGNVEIASTVTEHFNSSEVNHEFFPIHPTTEATSQYNVEVNTFNYYDFTVSTPEPYDKDVERWDASTHDLSAFESLPNYSVSDVTEASVSGVSPIFSRNDSASDGVPGWPVKLSAEVSGDLILGGLMMVHERQDNITCGPIMPQGGIQALETMLYTLDVLNKDQMIPNVTIGAHILDDCDKDTYGLEMAVDFIKGRDIFCL
ncbi:hypothetical protein B7P43_G12545 [Cryptotermes secundus]|uniref:Receptor ligand binding region domain-containing protein n=1 Tax=Cryptotermes secundus TaxID=105785 RepID=A0A2J7RRG5_9NEOP|nr:hypothetical protein B7P43_G12545 [Cryptotermes secundus]